MAKGPEFAEPPERHLDVIFVCLCLGLVLVAIATGSRLALLDMFFYAVPSRVTHDPFPLLTLGVFNVHPDLVTTLNPPSKLASRHIVLGSLFL